MNKEPEPLSREELLRVENIGLRREIVNQMDTMLVHDIAHAHMLDVADYGKTWGIIDGRIHVQPPTVAPNPAEEVAQEIAESV